MHTVAGHGGPPRDDGPPAARWGRSQGPGAIHAVPALGFLASPRLEAAAKAMPSASWFGLYGVETPELALVAVKVLSQVASSCSCERNWSAYDFIHSKCRNKLTSSRAEDLVYVFSNMQLAARIQAGAGSAVGGGQQQRGSVRERGRCR